MASSAGCGRFNTNVALSSPSVTTSSRLLYHDRRGLMRSFSFALPVNRSQVHLTSRAVNGLPSCQLTPLGRLKVSPGPSSLHHPPCATPGPTDPPLCFPRYFPLPTTPLT